MIRAFLAATLLLAATLPLRAEIAIQQLTTPLGINLWLVEDRTIPFAALELRFRGGSSLDAPGKSGATNLMSGLLEEGSGDLDSRGFARAVESLAASFRYSVSDDALAVSAKFLSENRAEAVALLRESLIAPRFDPEALERVRAQVLSSLRSDEKDPRAIASLAFDQLAFGSHPYAVSSDGTIATVTALTRDDILAAHRGALARDRLFVSLVGDISVPDAVALIDSLLGDLPETGAPLPGPADVTLTRGVTVVDFDTPQSVAIFGQPGIAMEDPDFFAAYLLDLILGGGSFESRLMQEVREKRGLTYGVYTYLADKDQADLWLGSVASANDRVAEAISVIRDEWQKARDGGVTQAELDDAKTYLTGAYPLRFDGNGPIANIMVGMQMMGLPPSYITTRNDQVNAVTLDDVTRVATRLLDPDSLRFVVVGKPTGLDVTSN